MTPTLLLNLLSRALTEELGLVITTNNPHQLNMRLSATIRANPQFSSLMIAIPSTPETLMIVKKTVSLDEDFSGDLT